MSLPLIHAGRTNPGLSAALDLRFALDKSLTAYRGPTPSFSRASTGSYFDGSGVLRYANVNIVQYSEQLDNAYWFKSGLSISADSTVAPDGKTTADKVVENASSGIKYGTITGGFSVVSGTTYTFSAYAKDSGRYFGFATNSTAFPNSIGAVFNLTNGTISNIQANTTASIQSIGNGWYRCIITGTANASTTTNINFGISNDLNQIYPSYTGNGSSGYFLWGFQMETGSTVGTYVPTTTAANSAPRFNHTYNGTSWVSKGLLVEEQRTNLCTHSEDITNSSWNKYNSVSILANNATAPNGILAADRLYPTVSGANLLEKVISGLTSGATYSYSYYAKSAGFQWIRGVEIAGSANFWVDVISGVVGTKGTSSAGPFSVSVAPAGNGWFKISVTSVANSTIQYIYTSPADADANTTSTPSGTNGILYWGFQFESGAFPTSYIPTTSASVTRSADVCQITGSDFSGFWNGTEGTIVLEQDLLSYSEPAADQRYFAVAGGSNNPGLTLHYDGGSNFYWERYFNAASNLVLSDVSASYKVAIAFKTNDYAAVLNGGNPVTAASPAFPTTFSKMDIGYQVGSPARSSHIARLRYFNKRLSNTNLQKLSDPDPTLNLQFALNKTLTPVAGPAPSFSRASTGTYFDASGVLTSAAINTPRFDHVFSGGQWVSKGLLIEEQRTNLILQSQDANNASWSKLDVTTSANNSAFVDGNVTAALMTASILNTGRHQIYQTITAGAGIYTFSSFVKKTNNRYIAVGINDNISSRYSVVVDLDTGLATTTLTIGSPANTSNSIVNCGSGWYRVSVTMTNAGTGVSGNVGLSNSATPANSFAMPSFLNSGTESMLLGGMQLEVGSFPTSYIPTTTAAVTRSADVCQITGTSFNWMWNQGEGSYSIEYNLLSTLVDQPLLYVNNGTVNESHRTFGSVATNQPPLFYSRSAGVTDAGFAFGATPVASGKIAIGAKANDLAGSLNGGAVITDSTVAMPVGINQLIIGIDNTPTRLNGHIAKLIYYPARLTNTKLQQLST